MPRGRDLGRPESIQGERVSRFERGMHLTQRFPVALEKFWAVSQSVCFYTTGLSHLSIPLTS